MGPSTTRQTSLEIGIICSNINMIEKSHHSSNPGKNPGCASSNIEPTFYSHYISKAQVASHRNLLPKFQELLYKAHT
jgi:hypothetical protein